MHPYGLALFALLLCAAAPAWAMPPAESPRPELRPELRAAPRAAAPMAMPTGAEAGAGLAQSIRPVPRVDPGQLAADRAATLGAFGEWLIGFRSRALADGIRPAAFDSAFAGVQPNTRILQRDTNQAEFARMLWDYLDGAVSDARIANGRAALARHADVLAQIERRYGVDANVVVAIWGLETAYGSMRGSTDIIGAMATLAFEGRRREFFETELIAALRILQTGEIGPRQMVGSWAGAMGHTQFMPTSYLALAVDFDGDGRRDIWSDNPVDALASTANYLRHHGWTKGQPWGVEVALPQGFDYSLTGAGTQRDAAFWARQGVRLADGGPVPDHGRASILVPGGHRGVALMIFDNFHVIARYNPANSYVIGVGHLSDRIAGGAAFRATWPRGDRGLSRAEREALQRGLAARGLHTGAIDGILGPQTSEAIRRFQASVGLVPDGYASPGLLDRLR
jgi:membrane-bound lytic murein transglycosylase B